MEFIASFSGGKDSFLAIKRMIDKGHRLAGIVVSTNYSSGKSWTHEIEKAYFGKISEVLKCEVIFTDSDIENYEKKFEIALEKFKNLGITTCIFGDIDIKEHIRWNRERCKKSGLVCIHPLLMEDRKSILKEFLSINIDTKIIKVKNQEKNKKYIGKLLSKELIEKMKESGESDFDICGENGEYHTVIDLKSAENITKIKKLFFDGIYLDNASTCFPKAIGVATEIENFVENDSYSINRGTYMNSYKLQSKIIDVRDKVVDLICADKDFNCVFSPSATFSINIILNGLLKNGDMIITDNNMHNSVYRTVANLKKNGVKEFKISEFDDIKYELYNNKVIFITLVENITGKFCFADLEYGSEEYIQFLNKCKKRGIIVVVDAVQAICEIDFSICSFRKDIANRKDITNDSKNIKDNDVEDLYKKENYSNNVFEQNYSESIKDRIINNTTNTRLIYADIVIFSSHIGLMGVEGLGISIISDGIADKIKPIIFGGSGSISNSYEMPEFLPDKLEVGTINLPAIVGLGKAIDYIKYIGIEKIIEKKHKLGHKLRNKLREIQSLEVSGNGSFCSVSVKDGDDSMLGFELDSGYGIMSRVGIHCSPIVHKKLGTFPNGSLRLSVGYYNDENDIDNVLSAFRNILI